MAKIIFLVVSIFFLQTMQKEQMKVARYSLGKPGTDQYEHLEFWTKDGKKTEVNYVYGKERNEVKLEYLGKIQLEENSGFKLQFPNRYILYIVPQGNQLRATDASGKYRKIFSWEYEGPVNGIGTYCDVCVEDEDDAITLLQVSYIK